MHPQHWLTSSQWHPAAGPTAENIAANGRRGAAGCFHTRRPALAGNRTVTNLKKKGRTENTRTACLQSPDTADNLRVRKPPLPAPARG